MVCNMNKSNKSNICIMFLNKGNAQLYNRVDQVNNLLSIHKPDIFTINELNLPSTDSITCHQFTGYTLEKDDLDLTDKTSRTGVLIKLGLQYKRRRDLEAKGCSTVWFASQNSRKKAHSNSFTLQTVQET